MLVGFIVCTIFSIVRFETKGIIIEAGKTKTKAPSWIMCIRCASSSGSRSARVRKCAVHLSWERPGSLPRRAVLRHVSLAGLLHSRKLLP